MRVFYFIFFLFVSWCAKSQENRTYWVYFNGKPDVNSKVFPEVNTDLIQLLKDRNIRIIGTSKWFNAAFVTSASEKEILALKDLKEVSEVERSIAYRAKSAMLNSAELNYGLADVQIEMLKLDSFHSMGYTGKGIKLALFDVGFFKVDSNIAFDSLRKRNGILATRDFVSNNNLVFDDDAHGMYVLSLVNGFYKDSLNGAAPDVDVILARTEDVASEKHIEEFNWIRAMEWADSIGVDIIHSSLGYSRFDSLQGDYTYQDMDGESTIITRAAEMAYQRGIFITNSAGNEGKSSWRYITAPCDGKNVLCVGSVDSFRRKSDFSSFGPSFDGRIKPDVMAMGSNVTIIGTNNILRRGGGTSFSGPLIAGFVACLKQKHPGIPNDVMLNAIRRSSDRYDHPNDSFGYGIPDILRADSLILNFLKISSPKQETFSIYPNPVEDILYLDLTTGIDKIKLLDLHGKVLKVLNPINRIDCSFLKPGCYFLEIEYKGNKRSSFRFLKS
ncbi:MAG: S8 family serine peptidase [Flavobacteriales bacterium]|nr:S8 family serine peptidase [Flavobacteriales bacterium]